MTPLETPFASLLLPVRNQTGCSPSEHRDVKQRFRAILSRKTESCIRIFPVVPKGYKAPSGSIRCPRQTTASEDNNLWSSRRCGQDISQPCSHGVLFLVHNLTLSIVISFGRPKLTHLMPLLPRRSYCARPSELAMPPAHPQDLNTTDILYITLFYFCR